MNIIGIDLSLTGTGVCALRDGGRTIAVGIITALPGDEQGGTEA